MTKKPTPRPLDKARAAAQAHARTQPCAWALVGTEWGHASPDAFTAPPWMLATVEPTWQGCMPPDVAAMLPLAARAIRNIAPTRQAILLPSFQAHDTNAARNAWSGLSGMCNWKSQGMLIAYAGKGAWEFLDTCLHEAWHAAEVDLTPDDFRLVRRSVTTGLPMPGDYYSAPEERTARAFTAYALYRLSSDAALRPTRTTLDRCDRTATDIYEEVLTGTYSPLRAHVDDGFWVALAKSYARDARDACAWLARGFHRLSGETSKNRRTA